MRCPIIRLAVSVLLAQMLQNLEYGGRVYRPDVAAAGGERALDFLALTFGGGPLRIA